ncbi:hypothetical protein PISMIDRAFT_623917 [Pisolithus microcarpus 441]|uniref:Uncharacterized protein n=1 Tax=Pisolithus microcarpus 441 TaxID=765257 RepID=A0A0C9YSD9_9AGAM|nr:hypothetical protein PISMIDRAFT_623917 [Pisolithus microcarpus 441]
MVVEVNLRISLYRLTCIFRRRGERRNQLDGTSEKRRPFVTIAGAPLPRCVLMRYRYNQARRGTCVGSCRPPRKSNMSMCEGSVVVAGHSPIAIHR